MNNVSARKRAASAEQISGVDYKEMINKLFEMVRNGTPSVTDDMLDTDGAIYYMNGNDGTEFEWDGNDRLCEFSVFHKNGAVFIKVLVNRDNTIDVFTYESDAINIPTAKSRLVYHLDARSFMNLMNRIADEKDLFDKPIDQLDWDIAITECEDAD